MSDNLVIADLERTILAAINRYMVDRDQNYSAEACHFVLDTLKEVCRTWQARLENAESEAADET